MKTKDQILLLLQKQSGAFLSGQEIADELFVTRACVWKSIKALKQEGYTIDAVTNKGYRLMQQMDEINKALISDLLSESGINIPIFHYSEVTSTNDCCAEYAKTCDDNCVIIADTQTEGRGRRGRSFYSPKNTGLYFSILIHPVSVLRLTDFTAYAASATAKAIDKVIFNGQNQSQIKWVNDIFINNQKVAGILTEAHTSLEDSQGTYVVIGIGINVYSPSEAFPKEIKDIAGTLIGSGQDCHTEGIRNALVINIVRQIFEYYLGDDFTKTECLNTYKEKSFLIGSYVKINDFSKNNKYALVTGISDDYHLLVKYDDGSEGSLSSGEVSVVKY